MQHPHPNVGQGPALVVPEHTTEAQCFPCRDRGNYPALVLIGPKFSDPLKPIEMDEPPETSSSRVT
jgi:hypothetical protein